MPVCGDWVQLARTMRPDEIAQFEAMTGRDYNADQAAGAFIAAPGIKYALIGADSAAFAAGCFEHVRPGVIETWGVGTLPAWSQHWRAITKVCRRQIDSFLANGAHRVQIVSLASRTAAHACKAMSGGSNRAAQEANRAEQARQAAIAGTQARVNQVFDSPGREADIADYVGAVREYFTDDLSRQKTNSDRDLKFALARGGNIGGSTQRDQQKVLGEEYGRGVLEVERRSQGAGAELRANDQDARARLISLATSGLVFSGMRT